MRFTVEGIGTRKGYAGRQRWIVVAVLGWLVVAGCGGDDEPVRPLTIGSLGGRVVDESGAPIAGVAISSVPSAPAATTNDDGMFEIGDVEMNAYTLTARRSGYETRSVIVVVPAGKRVTADIILRIAGSGEKNLAPLAPSNPWPSDGRTAQAAPLRLEWSCGDPENDSLFYDIYLGTSNPPTERIAAGISDTTIVQPDLALATTYYWRVVARDRAGNETEGTVWSFSTARNAPPKGPGYALLLPDNRGRTSANVLVSTSDKLFLNNRSFTLEAWVKAASLLPEFQFIINRGWGNSQTDFLLGIDKYRVVFQARSWGNILFGPPVLLPEQWYHIAAVQDVVKGEVMIYLDGEMVAWQLLNGGPVNTGAPIVIGARSAPNGDAVEGIVGMLDELRIWDYPRTQREIRSTMKRPLTGEESGLRACWRFDEGIDSTTVDISTNGYNGVLRDGADWVISDAPIE